MLATFSILTDAPSVNFIRDLKTTCNDLSLGDCYCYSKCVMVIVVKYVCVFVCFLSEEDSAE